MFVYLFEKLRLFLNYTDSINLLGSNSETYTIIVGFVIIGVPLALQNVKNDSDKYSNKLLVNRYTTGKIISPMTLVVFSVVYILISFSAKGLDNASVYRSYVNFILFILFFMTVFSSGYFYIRFYRRVTTSSKRYVINLLDRKEIRENGLLNEKNLSKFFLLELYLLYLNKFFFFNKLSDKKIERYDAGLELLINKFKDKNYSESFFNIFVNFINEVKKSIFGEFSNKKI